MATIMRAVGAPLGNARTQQSPPIAAERLT
jgi:hypothetical protein